jgi:hypothetical protein
MTRRDEGRAMKTGRQPEPRIESLDTYPKRWVPLIVARRTILGR